MDGTEVTRRTRIVYIALAMIMGGLGVAALGWGSRAAAAPTATVRYVDAVGGSDGSDCTNPADPCQNIQYAVDQSSAGDEIRVAEGSYEGIFLNFPVSILGGYEASGWMRDISAHPTVVDGGGVWAGHLIHLVSGADLFLEGFTVQGAAPAHDGGGFGIFSAMATISATVVQSNTALAGAGLWADGSEVTLVNSVLNNNVITQSGAAIGACCNSTLTLNNVDVLDNTAPQQGGGLWACGSTLTVTDSTLAGNTASGDYGGAMYLCDGAAATIMATTITSNTAGSGGGLALQSGARATIEESLIGTNMAGGGGGGIGVWDGSVLTMTRSMLKDNTSFSQGGGIHLASVSDVATIGNSLIVGNSGVDGSGSGVDNWGSLTLFNVTVADNPCGGPGLCSGGVSNRDPAAQLNITNSILAGHDQGDLSCAAGTCTVAYSDIADSTWPGMGNISADPLFVDPGAGDYHLQVHSPAVDAGTAVGAPAVDLEGTLRDSMPDMGAYEWSGFQNYLPLILKE